MICPACRYETGWSGEKLQDIKGEYGDFYRLPVVMERPRAFDMDRSSLYACPKCGTAFIDDHE